MYTAVVKLHSSVFSCLSEILIILTFLCFHTFLPIQISSLCCGKGFLCFTDCCDICQSQLEHMSSFFCLFKC